MAGENEQENQYRLCPSCGNFSHVLERNFFCILCGTKLIDSCANCGTPIIHPHGKFCHHCGSTYRTDKVGTDR